MTLNEKKLTEIVEAVMNVNNLIRHLPFDNACSHYIDATTLRKTLAPFAMEMTDEEIMNEAEKCSSNSLVQSGFMMGAKLIQNGKTETTA